RIIPNRATLGLAFRRCLPRRLGPDTMRCQKRGRALRELSIKVLGVFSLALALTALWASPCVALDPTRSLAQLSHTAYARDEGLPGGVTAVTQAPDGYLLVGTHHGLYRFNGVRFEQLDQRRLLSPDIFSLSTSVSGEVWVGYNNGGLTRIRAGTMISYP